MRISRCLLTISLLCACWAARPQTPEPARAASDVGQGLAPAPPPPAASLTPEKRADILLARKSYREAIDLYKTCPQTAYILNKIGIAYHQMNELDLARRYYQRAMKENPKYPEAVNNLGTVFYTTKSYRRAISQYRRALVLSPDSASIYSNLGTAFFARKKYKEASEAYQKAVDLDPEVFERRSSYGSLLQERNVEERAKFHYYLAKTYAKAGKTELALQCIRKALEEGFKERNKFVQDPEFVKLQELPEFKEIMAQEPRVL